MGFTPAVRPGSGLCLSSLRLPRNVLYSETILCAERESWRATPVCAPRRASPSASPSAEVKIPSPSRCNQRGMQATGNDGEWSESEREWRFPPSPPSGSRGREAGGGGEREGDRGRRGREELRRPGGASGLPARSTACPNRPGRPLHGRGRPTAASAPIRQARERER